MDGIQRIITELGGVVSAGEFRERGHPGWRLRMLADYGRIVRIRKGWYAAADTPVDLIRAWRVGGRLACTSALAFHGLISEDLHETRLHVSVPLDASRLRHPDDWRQRLTSDDDDHVMVHWTPPDLQYERRGPRSRLIVPLETALEQAEHCRPRTTPAWTLRRDTL